nr:hypothetical protein [Psychromicrobium sp. YIM S02556]
MELCADLWEWQGVVGEQIDESNFFLLNLAEFVGQAGTGCFEIGMLPFGGGGESADEVIAEGRIQLESAVDVSDFFFHNVSRDVRKVAVTALAGTAEEVFVEGVAATFDFGEDDAAGLAATLTFFAEDHAFENMVVDAITLARPTACSHDNLDLIEQFLGDDGFVAAGVDLPLMPDIAGVVRILQGFMEVAGGYRPLRENGRWPDGEATIRQGGFQPVDGVLAGGVQLEGFSNQGSTLFVDADGVHHAATDVLADVEVPKRGFGDSATVASFVFELDADVFPAEFVLHLVDGVGDVLHGFALDGFTEVLAGGDELDADSFEVALRDDGIFEIAECT